VVKKCIVCGDEALEAVIMNTLITNMSAYLRIKKYIGWENKLCRTHWKKALRGKDVLKGGLA